MERPPSPDWGVPSNVRALVDAAGLEYGGVVPWGTDVPCNQPGVYIVGLDPDPASTAAAVSPAPISARAVDNLLATRPELTMDGVRPSSEDLMNRLRGFWLSDEVVLYVGLARSTLAGRVNAYYTTKLGARSPHAGGWFLKTLTAGSSRWVHWARASDPARAEDQMLATFCSNVSDASRHALHDPDRPFPFANLEWPPGIRKRHGILGAKISRTPPPMGAPVRGASETPASAVPPAVSGGAPLARSTLSSLGGLASSMRSQQVTGNDRGTGQIRIPPACKEVFPLQPANVAVNLRGRYLECRWNPRTGPDRERSGVLRVERQALAELVPVGTRLVITAMPGRGVEFT